MTDDNRLDEALNAWARDESGVSPDFADRLARIAQTEPQSRPSLVARVVRAFGGWGFAAPQLAGLAAAAYFGVVTGQAQTPDAWLTDDWLGEETQIMAAHLFADEEFGGWIE
ncbi:MAG: hypothetical protein AAGJ09_14495 [Pseudomonadota bacterium]